MYRTSKRNASVDRNHWTAHNKKIKNNKYMRDYDKIMSLSHLKY